MRTESKSGALAPLRNRDFRYLLAGFAVGQMLMPLQFVTQILWVQALAPSNVWLVLVALIGASRGLATLTFGLFGGALADRVDRRTLLLSTQLLLSLITVLLAAIMHFGKGGTVAFILFFMATFVAACLQSVDAPTRLAIVPDILGAEGTPAGISLNQVAGQMAVAPALLATGLLIDAIGFSGAYLLSVVGHAVAIACISRMRVAGTVRQHAHRFGPRQSLRDIREGLAYTRNHKTVFWVVVLLVAMVGLGLPATGSLGPTWITTVVGVEVRYVGFVAMTWGIGALVAALILARFSSFERHGLLVGGGALLFCISFVVFVIDPTVTNAVLGNLGLGAGLTITMVSSTILIQNIVSNEVRGRIMSILQLNMGVAQTMTMPIAVLGQWLTLGVLFPMLAFTTLGTVLALLLLRPQILAARVAAVPP
ncbi:MAG: MFS transporter [Gammaproteobacteria bacterium]|nr:MFS transporter [Gammaproteobacteria bacterium]